MNVFKTSFQVINFLALEFKASLPSSFGISLSFPWMTGLRPHVEVVLSQHCNVEGQLFCLFVYERDSINICGNGALTKSREICYVTWTFNSFFLRQIA